MPSTATPLGATPPPGGAGFGLGRSSFQMADGRAGGAADPGASRSTRCCFRYGSRSSTTTSRFPATTSSGCRTFSRSSTIPLALVVARPDDRALGRGGRHRIRPRTGAGAGDGEDVPRPRDRHVDPDHPAVHQSGDRRPILGAVSAAAVRTCRLPPEPTRGPPGGDQLGRRSPLGLHLDHRRRRLAVDPVHVRHPARRPGGDTAAPLRGGRAGRRRRFPDLPLRDDAAAGAGDAARDHLSPAGRRQALRRHLHVDRRRPGHGDLHDVLLSLSDRIPAVPSFDGDGRKLAFPDSAVGGDHGARAPPARGRRPPDGRSCAPAPIRSRCARRSASSLCSCSCRSTGSSSPRSSPAATT